MPTTIDYLTDPVKTGFVEISREFDLPDFVKQASQEDLVPEATGEAVSSFYALPGRRAYPVHSKAAAWLSAAYFHKYASSLSEYEKKLAGNRLKDILNFYDLKSPIPKAAVVEEIKPEDYLISVEEKGQTLQRLPVRNLSELKMAVSYLREHRSEFPYVVRKQASVNLLRKAEKMNYPLERADRVRLEQDAGNALMIPSKLARVLHKRAILAEHLGRLDEAEAFGKSAKALYESEEDVVATDIAETAVHAIESFDQTAGLSKEASQGLYEMTDFELRELSEAACVLRNGSMYDSRDFSQLKLAHVRAALGEDLAERVKDSIYVDPKKANEEFSSLPAEKAYRLDSLCEASGVLPMTRLPIKAVGFTPEELNVLAGKS